MQQPPPIDQGGVVGAQPTSFRWPTNPAINDAVRRTIAFINRECDVRVDLGTTLTLSSGISTNGPYYVNLTNGLNTTITNGLPMQVDTIKHVEWTDTNGTGSRLHPVSYLELDRIHSEWVQMPPSTPQYYWTEGYQMAVLPAPAFPGIFNLYTGVGFIAPVADTDTIDQLPADMQIYVEYGAVVEISKMTTQDVEARDRISAFQPMVVEGIKQIRTWLNEQNYEYQPFLLIQVGRRNYLRRKVSRY